MARLLCMAALLVAACGGSQTSDPPTTTPGYVRSGLEACRGSWSGTAVQSSGPWTLTMDVTLAGTCGTIEYPSLGCGGFLTDCASLPDGSASFVEVYTHDLEACAAAGRIVARCTNDEMRWHWEGEGGPVETVLTRP